MEQGRESSSEAGEDQPEWDAKGQVPKEPMILGNQASASLGHSTTLMSTRIDETSKAQRGTVKALSGDPARRSFC